MMRAMTEATTYNSHKIRGAFDSMGNQRSHFNSYYDSSYSFHVEPPSSGFLKINNVKDGGQQGGASFVIHNAKSLLIAVGGSSFYDMRMPQVVLKAAWEHLIYGISILQMDNVILERDLGL